MTLLLTLIILFSPCVQSAKLLLLPFSIHGHTAIMKAIGQVLHDGGHEVHILLPSIHPWISKDLYKPLKLLTFDSSHSDIPKFMKSPEESWEFLKHHGSMEFAESIYHTSSSSDKFCHSALADAELYETLKKVKFDMAFVDAFPFTQCFYVLCYKLGLPYISVAAQPDSTLIRRPVLPINGVFQRGGHYGSNMGVIERLHNVYTTLKWCFITGTTPLQDIYTPTAADSLITRYVHDKPAMSIGHLAQQSLLWMVEYIPVLHEAEARMTYEIPISGIQIDERSLLPENLNTFVNLSQDGLVIVSFGSLMPVPHFMIEKFISVFEKLPQLHFVARFEPSVNTLLPKNVFCMEHIPQQELLSSVKTVLAITHGGVFTMAEVLYFGIPSIILPVHADQHHHCRMVEQRELGLCMDMFDFDVDNLAKAILVVINNDTYKRQALLAATLMRTSPEQPKQSVLFWTNHVLQYGGRHLRANVQDLTWYEFWMLDILAICFFTYCVIKFLLKVLKYCCYYIC